MEQVDNVVAKKTRMQPVPVIKQKVLYVWVGQFGLNVGRKKLEEYSPEEFPHFHNMIIDSDGMLMNDHFLNEPAEGIAKWLDESDRFHGFLLGEDGLGTGGRPEIGKGFAEKKMDEISSIVSEMHHVVIVMGAAGGTGGGAGPQIAKKSLELGKPTLACIVMPHEWEGDDRQGRALQVRNQLLESVPVLTFYNGYSHKVIPADRKLTTEESNLLLNEHGIEQALDITREIVEFAGNVRNADNRDYFEMLQAGKFVQIGYSVIEEEEGSSEVKSPEEVVDELFNHKLQNNNIASVATRAIVAIHNPGFDEETKDILMKIKSGMSNTGASLKVNIRRSLKDKKRWVGAFFVSEKEGELKQERKRVKKPGLEVPAAITIRLPNGNGGKSNGHSKEDIPEEVRIAQHQLQNKLTPTNGNNGKGRGFLGLLSR